MEITKAITTKEIFQIPVYRCDRKTYTEQMEAEKQDFLAPFRISEGYEELESFKNAVIWFDKKYWYPWVHNEIVGWLDGVAFLSEGKADIDIYYFLVDKKRITRRIRDKRYQFQKTLYTLRFLKGMESKVIFGRINGYLEDLRTGRDFKKRYIDLDTFAVTGPLLDWAALLRLG